MANELVKHQHANNDRVTVGFTRKFNLGNYQTLDVNVGLSSDRESGDTIEEAFEAVEKIVLKEFEKLCNSIDGKQTKKGGK